MEIYSSVSGCGHFRSPHYTGSQFARTGGYLFVLLLVIVFRKVITQTIVNLLGTGRTNTYLFSDEFEKAAEFATEQLAKNPKDVVAYLTRSTAYIHLGKLEAARADCDMALSLTPSPFIRSTTAP